MRRLFQCFICYLLVSAQPAWADSAVAFMYHRFGESDYASTNVTLAQFERHLQFLADDGFEVWPLSRILATQAAGEKLPERVAAITIDDAYASIYHQAFPRLKARGWPFTVFVSTDAVDNHLPAFLSWDQMREMQQHRASFANHTRTHDHLLVRQKAESEAAWLARVRADIEYAESRLQAELGEIPKLFAYPYGEYDARLMQLLKEMGYPAFGQHSGAFSAATPRQALPRFPINQRYAEQAGFVTKARALPMPVVQQSEFDPLTADRHQPLELTLAKGALDPRNVNCFIGGQGKVEIDWIDRAQNRLRIVPPAALEIGRTRYNCTAASAQKGRFFWFSQPWYVVEKLP